jgi:hypothetical protein
MRFTQRLIIVAAAATAIVASAGAVRAHGFNGNIAGMSVPALSSYGGHWPVTITQSQRSNGTGCLTLTGSMSGSASLTFGSQSYPSGSFLVMNGILVATITQPLYGQNGALMFIAHAIRGSVGHGTFEDIEGGSNFDEGSLAFGRKNSC